MKKFIYPIVILGLLSCESGTGSSEISSSGAVSSSSEASSSSVLSSSNEESKLPENIFGTYTCISESNVEDDDSMYSYTLTLNQDSTALYSHALLANKTTVNTTTTIKFERYSIKANVLNFELNTSDISFPDYAVSIDKGEYILRPMSPDLSETCTLKI